MKITLVRHTSVDVLPGTCYGQSDVALAPTFMAEAAKVAHNLKGRHFDIAFTSPLSRCTRLAEYCGYGNALRDSRLMEMNFGEWEMMRYDEITDPLIEEWYADYVNVAPRGGESFMDQHRRVADFFRSLRGTRARSAIIFTHGGVMAHAMLLSGEASLENLFSKQPRYGEIIEIELSSLAL